jgi:hypothetical protein
MGGLKVVWALRAASRPRSHLAFTVCLLVTCGLAAHAAGSRPPLPPNGKDVSPGQVPRTCAPGEAAAQGYYFSDRAQQQVAAPFCYGRWGNLYASGSQIVAAGASVTVTATPSEGSNSGTYAPQTGSTTWQYPGKIVSGCGPKNLSCTVIPTAGATAEWQWFQFHVSMPRTFFIDSLGDLCGGQPLCAGATTNAWSYVGIAPAGAASAIAPPPAGAMACQRPCCYLFSQLSRSPSSSPGRGGTAGRPVKQSMAGSSELTRIQEANDGWSASHPDPLQVDPTAGGPTKAGQLKFQKDLQECNRQLAQHLAELQSVGNTAAAALGGGGNTPVQPNPTGFGGLLRLSRRRPVRVHRSIDRASVRGVGVGFK